MEDSIKKLVSNNWYRIVRRNIEEKKQLRILLKENKQIFSKSDFFSLN